MADGPVTTDHVCIVGVTYEIVDNAEVDEHGEFSADEARIKIGKCAPNRRWSILRHEIAHAVSEEIGFQDRLRDLGLSEHLVAIVDEAVSGHFVPAYCDTLERRGWLHPPAPPVLCEVSQSPKRGSK